ncbi:UNVERIFIED_ORG: hypothetical protein ABIC48_000735 [Burkholderia territorii]
MSCGAQANDHTRNQHMRSTASTRRPIAQRDRYQRSRIGILAATQSSVVGGSEIDLSLSSSSDASK